MSGSSMLAPGPSSWAESASSSKDSRLDHKSTPQTSSSPYPIFSAPLSAKIPSNASSSFHIKFPASSESQTDYAQSNDQNTPTPLLQITRLQISPQSQHRKSSSAFHTSRRRKPIQINKEATIIAQLENTLKLRSLGVASSRPDPATAPKVTLSDQCRPDPKVIFDQSHFIARPRRHRQTRYNDEREKHNNAKEEQLLTPSTSTPAARQVDGVPSDDSTNTMTSPASMGSLLNGPITAATSSMTPGIDSQSVTSTSSSVSPPVKKPAWSTPRSWAEMAAARNGNGSNIVIVSNQVFSENVGDSDVKSRRLGGRSGENSDVGASKRKQSNGKSKSYEPIGLEEAIKKAEDQFTAPLTYPRGMVNRGNMCFANAILQVLVYCAPFYNLFQLVGEYVSHDFYNSTPLMEAVVVFLSEFRRISPSLQKSLQETPGLAIDLLRDVQAASEPFVPEYLYDAMKLNKRFDAMRKGHQEDAEEFLGFFLDTLHEELLTAIRISNEKLAAVKSKDGKGLSTQQGKADRSEQQNGLRSDAATTTEREVKRPTSPSEGDGWLEVGQKGRTSITRTTSTAHSPITRIFGGKLRSLLRIPGSKDSVTLEPYQPLQLDIQPGHVTTIEEALQNLTVLETISGVQSTLNRGMVEATKQVFIETLPPILILHLKRFVYDDVGGVQKSCKVVSYNPVLEISESVISPARRGETKRRYRLFGVIYHHGNRASGGHYTVDVLKQDQTEWLHIDDTQWTSTTTPSVRNGGESIVTKQNSREEGVAYLLFYVREDAVLSNGIVTNAAVNGQLNSSPQHHRRAELNNHLHQHHHHQHQRMASVTSQKSFNAKR